MRRPLARHLIAVAALVATAASFVFAQGSSEALDVYLEALRSTSDCAKAIPLFETAIKLDPIPSPSKPAGSGGHLEYFPQFQLAVCYLKLGNAQQARGYFAIAKAFGKLTAKMREDLKAYDKQIADILNAAPPAGFSQAAAQAERLLREQQCAAASTQFAVAKGLSSLWFTKNSLAPRAAEAERCALSQDMEAEGQAFFAARQLDRAEERFTSALKTHPDARTAQQRLADIRTLQQRYDVEKRRGDGDSRAGNLAGAMSAYEAALAIHPDRASRDGLRDRITDLKTRIDAAERAASKGGTPPDTGRRAEGAAKPPAAPDPGSKSIATQTPAAESRQREYTEPKTKSDDVSRAGEPAGARPASESAAAALANRASTDGLGPRPAEIKATSEGAARALAEFQALVNDGLLDEAAAKFRAGLTIYPDLKSATAEVAAVDKRRRDYYTQKAMGDDAYRAGDVQAARLAYELATAAYPVRASRDGLGGRLTELGNKVSVQAASPGRRADAALGYQKGQKESGQGASAAREAGEGTRARPTGAERTIDGAEQVGPEGRTLLNGVRSGLSWLTPGWVGAVGTVTAVCVALLLLLRDRRSDRASLRVALRAGLPEGSFATLAPPDAEVAESVFVLRLAADNAGRATARAVEAIVHDLEIQKDGAWVPVESFLASNLRWTHTGERQIRLLAPGAGRHFDLGNVRRDGSTEDCLLVLSVVPRPVQPFNVLGPGVYRFSITLAAENAPAARTRLELSFRSRWSDSDEARILQGIALKEVP